MFSRFPFGALRAATLAVLAATAAQCTPPRTSEGGRCVFNGDCVDPLICAGQYCRAQCLTDRDCPNGLCSGADQPEKRVCLPVGSAQLCSTTSPCTGANVTCTSEGVCRQSCNTAADCAGGGC